jgi:hypothetical protein
MEITIRHVLDVSPQLAELLGRLVGEVVRHAPVPSAVVPSPAVDVAPAAAAVALSSDAAGPEPARETLRRPRDNWRTAERRAVLERMYPAGEALDVIRAALVMLPGPALPEAPTAVGHWASYLLLRRPADGEAPWRTPERQAILREAWPAGVDAVEIAARMRALPGGKVLEARLSVWASQLGLYRPDWYKQKLANERTARIAETRWEKREPAATAPVVAAVPAPVARPVVASVVPPVAPAPAPPGLPAPSEDGVIRASFREIQAWGGHYGIRYDGANVDQVNRRRAALNLPPVAQCEARTMADRRAA